MTDGGPLGATVELYRVDTGEPEAGNLPPLVLLHGIGASGEDWESQVPCFSPLCRVIVPDLRGYGRSPKGDAYSVNLFAADVWALLDQLGIERFNLIGHSMGGAVALRMAVDRPSRVHRLVLADTLPAFVADTFPKLVLYWYRLGIMWLFGPARLAAAVQKKLFPKPEQAAIRARLTAREAKHDRTVYLRTIHALRGWSITTQLQKLTMPALVLAAEHDYFPRADAEASPRRCPMPNWRIFDDTHHHLPLEVPERFNAVVLEFLNRG